MDAARKAMKMNSQEINNQQINRKRDAHMENKINWIEQMKQMNGRKGIKVGIHIIRNFPYGSPNRDMDNAPKTCFFGQVKRSRISSQCWKRNWRESMCNPEMEQSYRSKELANKIIEKTLSICGEDEKNEMGDLITWFLSGSNCPSGYLDGGADKNLKTSCLLFFQESLPGKIAEFLLQEKDTIKKYKEKKALDKAKGKAKGKEGTSLGKGIDDLVSDYGNTPDIAFFGRMIAKLPQGNIDSAICMAHSFSTHQIMEEVDAFTAIDDLDSNGAGYLEDSIFNSSCHYCNATIDVSQFVKNLNGEKDLAMKYLAGIFSNAVYGATPQSKKTGTNITTEPSFVAIAVQADGCPINLCNAFVKPIKPFREEDTVSKSISALIKHWNEITSRGKQHDIKGSYWCLQEENFDTMSGLVKNNNWDKHVASIMEIIEDYLLGK